jgi:BirA family biotin operon repressor/biotin-[acetyl-CoA-carboxylase] ligase
VDFEEENYLAGDGTKWTLHHYRSAGSTNDICRELPEWTAVRADVQTKGRGRFGRAFVSGQGGLWISAVMPATGGAQNWAGFSLRVGACLLRYLKSLGISSARLRWPNDLMCGPLKVAGLLIEQPSNGMLIVGFGLNITNEPWVDDAALRSTATNLAEWIEPPDLTTVAHGVLDALSSAHREMLLGGMAAAIEELNRSWEIPSPVEIHLNTGKSVSGLFKGLDAEGHLQLLDEDGFTRRVEHPLVERLREILP